MEQYVLKYLYDGASDESMKRLLDYCKFQLDCRLWSAGRHIPYSYDTMREHTLYTTRAMQSPRKRLRAKFHQISQLFAKKQGKEILYQPIPTKKQTNRPYTVLSLVNIPSGSREKIEAEGVEYYYANLDGAQLSGYVTPAMVKIHEWHHTYVRYAVFNELIQPENAAYLDKLYHQLVEELKALPIDAVLVRTSELFFEKLMIDALRELGRPSITVLHGLPGIYTKATEGRADYLTVWGERIRENFIKVGYDSKRVLVAGNYKYDIVPTFKTLRASLEDVLVLTSAPFAEHQHEWEWEKFDIQDRGLLITYLYSVESALKKAGVQSARLRPHPAVNKEWLIEYVDKDFYQIDTLDFIQSLTQATLCVGQTSSTFLEALMCGVTYIPYEPSEEGKIGMGRTEIVPPFDGSESTLKTAYTEAQLLEMIKSRYSPDFDMTTWMQGFDAKVIRKILEHR